MSDFNSIFLRKNAVHCVMLCTILAMVGLTSCKKEEIPPIDNTGTSGSINSCRLVRLVPTQWDGNVSFPVFPNFSNSNKEALIKYNNQGLMDSMLIYNYVLTDPLTNYVTYEYYPDNKPKKIELINLYNVPGPLWTVEMEYENDRLALMRAYITSELDTDSVETIYNYENNRLKSTVTHKVIDEFYSKFERVDTMVFNYIGDGMCPIGADLKNENQEIKDYWQFKFDPATIRAVPNNPLAIFPIFISYQALLSYPTGARDNFQYAAYWLPFPYELERLTIFDGQNSNEIHLISERHINNTVATNFSNYKNLYYLDGYLSGEGSIQVDYEYDCVLLE